MHARRRAGSARSALLVTTLLACACAEQPTAPSSALEGPSTPSLSDPTPASMATPVDVLERTQPLAEEERVSRTIGVLGGVILLPRAGLTVVVPPGALSAPTSITVVAPAGSLVGYELFPEGRTFAVPLVLRQSMLGTEAAADLPAPGHLVAAYFTGELGSVVDALELLSLDVLGSIAVFHVEHFSGYVIGTN